MSISKAFLLLLATVVAQPATRPYVVGHLDAPQLTESSGIVESRRHPGVYWTHNDSGNEPILYAVRRDGSLINQFPVRCVAFDWEDIAIDDEGHLYLGDIGNNGNVRAAIGVMMLDEPDPNVAPAPRSRLQPKRQWLLTYSDNARMDCEALFVWKGEGYLIRKSVDRSPTTVWRFSLSGPGTQELEEVARLPMKVVCTGADLSPDGDRLAMMTDVGPVLSSALGGDMQRLANAGYSQIRIDPQVNEAVCFTTDGLLGTSERRHVYYFPLDAFAAPTTQPR